ncbi:hypothetical protein H9L39_09576 [Fusarium oxysporum f. sp. albedinis]|nr:hypothetical protein H9L39_09576 [Fusarium oxysporum f. sp. albedinis]
MGWWGLAARKASRIVAWTGLDDVEQRGNAVESAANSKRRQAITEAKGDQVLFAECILMSAKSIRFGTRRGTADSSELRC